MQKITQNYVHGMNIARDIELEIERENVCWNEWLKEQENTTD